MAEFKADDGTHIAFSDHGSGPVVILIHGWMMDSRVFTSTRAAMKSAVRIITPDLRGAGASGKPGGGFTLARYAADIVQLADHLGLERFTVVGHSMGGQIAQLVAIEAADRVDGVVLLSSVPASGMKLPDDAHGLFFGSAGNRELQGTILDIATLELDADVKSDLLDGAGALSEACIQGAYNAWTGGGFAARLGEIKAPTLVVASDDPFLPPDFLQAGIVDLIANAELTVLKGPGHYIPCERPADTAALIDGFLAR